MPAPTEQIFDQHGNVNESALIARTGFTRRQAEDAFFSHPAYGTMSFIELAKQYETPELEGQQTRRCPFFEMVEVSKTSGGMEQVGMLIKTLKAGGIGTNIDISGGKIIITEEGKKN